MNGSHSPGGAYWRKRNDKVITFDMKRPAAPTGPAGFNRTSGYDGRSGYPTGPPEPKFMQARDMQGSPMRRTESGIMGGTLAAKTVTSYECKPELVEKFLGLLYEVGNEDFDAQDLKEQDSMIKRSEIIKRGILNLRNETKKVTDLQAENKQLHDGIRKERDNQEKEHEKLRKQLDEQIQKHALAEKEQRNRDKESGMADYQKKIEDLEKQLAIEREANQQKTKEIEEKNRIINELSGHTKDYNKKGRELEKKTEEQEREKDRKDKEEERLKELEALRKRVLQLDEERKTLLQKIEDQDIEAKRKFRDWLEEKEKLEKEIKELKEKIAKLERSQGDKDSILNKLVSQIVELNRTRSQIEDK